MRNKPLFGKKVSLLRRTQNIVALGLTGVAALLVLAPLFAIFGYLLVRGVGALSWSFLIHAPAPVGETGGGIGNGIAGSAIILGIACLIGIPIGIGAGIYLAEYGRRGRMGTVVRFTADVLGGVPSIVVGLTVYALIVITQKHFSAFAGGVALGLMMLPTITRSTEEMLLVVPHSIREAALGLGIPQWRAMLSITLPTAASGVITGVMLAFARVAGETAPLLFTALGNQFWNWNLNQPTAALPLQIFTYAISPYEEWHRQAWAGALVLIAIIVGIVAFVRLLARRGMLKVTA
jgi:phosphate transport system permease protein